MIKRNVAFKLRAYGENNGQRLDLKAGCQINNKSA